MPDDRQSGLSGSGLIRFNRSDYGSISGVPDKRRSKNQQEQEEKKEESEESPKPEYVDRSAQLRATLNSLAMLNVASVIKTKHNHPESASKNVEEDEELE